MDMANISSSLIAFNTLPKGEFTRRPRNKYVSTPKAATKERKKRWEDMVIPNIVGWGILGSPSGPPVKETQLLIMLKIIIWKAKVVMTK